MFKIGRKWIDDTLSNCELDYISPNNRDRYIRLEDYMRRQTEGPKDEIKKKNTKVRCEVRKMKKSFLKPQSTNKIIAAPKNPISVLKSVWRCFQETK